MGVYTFNEASYIQNVEAIIPNTDNLMEASMQIAYESTVNYNNIMRAVGIQEANYLAETGQELVYEGATGEGFFAKLKAFFVKIWQKIKGLFTKFMALINSYTKSDKDFLSKYKKQLASVDISKMTYSGYKFTHDAIKIKTAKDVMFQHINKKFGITGDGFADYNTFESAVHGVIKNNNTKDDQLKNVVDKIIDEDVEDIVEELRGLAIGDNNTYTASEFSKELFSKLRNGEDSKEEFDNMRIGDYVTWLQGSAEAKKEADKTYKENKKYFEDAIKWCEKMSKAVSVAASKKNDDFEDSDPYKIYSNGPKSSIASITISLISRYNSLIKSASNILALINGAILTAIKDQSRQAKAICVKALTFKPKNESASLFDDDFHTGSLLENVKLI